MESRTDKPAEPPNAAERETRLLVQIVLIGFALNALSWAACFFERNSLAQLVSFRIGDTAALMGCLAASRYVGNRGLQTAAVGFGMLGIVHGVSASAAGLTSVNAETNANMIVPMVPAFVMMLGCRIFPTWLRLAGLGLVIPFGWLFYRIAARHDYFDWTLFLAYGLLVIVEVCWAAFIWRDFRGPGERLEADVRKS